MKTQIIQKLTILKDFYTINKVSQKNKYFILNKLENLSDAILSFEQAIKHNNSRKAVTKALYEIAKIKIELRDYY